VLLSGVLLTIATAAHGLVIGGGGAGGSDCLVVFDAEANTPVARPRHVRCADGDACDADGVVNGACVFPVAVCANSTFDPRCTVSGVASITVEHALDNGDPRFDPDFQALQTRIDDAIDPPANDADSCTAATHFRVTIEGPFAGNRCRTDTKLVRMTTVSQVLGGRVYADRDRLKLICDPAPDGCDPMLFYESAFDRIQRQIFDQRCATSGCHDSQSTAGGLLLETGASYAQLIDVTPINGPAAAEGWKRVTVVEPGVEGDPVTSFLYRKITGDLPPGAGVRMPFDGPPYLNPTLADVVRNWILHGAPQTGWPPGTF
jgi:hypothetical protein